MSTGSVDPGDLVVEGIPPIPIEIAESAKKYNDFRGSLLAGWHPRRREMLVLHRPISGQTLQLHLVEKPLENKIQLASNEDRTIQASYQPTDGQCFVFSKDVGGGEWFQNFRFDCASREITMLTDGKSKNTPGIWSHKGDRIAYGSTKRNGKDIDFYTMDPRDPSTGKCIIELSQGIAWSVLDWSPDHQKLLALESISVNETYLWIIDVGTGERRAVTPRQSDTVVAHREACFSHDGSSIFATTNKDSEFLRLARIDISTGPYTFLTTHINWDIEAFALSYAGDQIAFVSNEAGVSFLHFLDLASGADRVVENLPMGVISRLNWHQDGQELGFVLSSARTPTNVFSVEVLTGRLTRWTETDAPGLDITRLAEPTLIHWPSFDQLSISGFLYTPDPARFPGPRPVMIIIHGGPEAQSRPSFLGEDNYYLEELGLALVVPNIRGSTGYGKRFVDLDNGLLRADAYRDIGALLDWIGAQAGMLDPARVLVSGGSYGGHVTLAVATMYPERIACAVDVVGMSNLVTFLERTEAYRQDLRRAEYGDERDPATRAFLESIAPINHAEAITKPLLVVQGRNDPRVPHTESEQMVATLRRRGTPVWYLMALDEGHGFAKKRNQDFELFATILFIRTYLLA